MRLVVRCGGSVRGLQMVLAPTVEFAMKPCGEGLSRNEFTNLSSIILVRRYQANTTARPVKQSNPPLWEIRKLRNRPYTRMTPPYLRCRPCMQRREAKGRSVC